MRPKHPLRWALAAILLGGYYGFLFTPGGPQFLRRAMTPTVEPPPLRPSPPGIDYSDVVSHYCPCPAPPKHSPTISVGQPSVFH